MKTAMNELFDWIEETSQPINKELLLKIKELSFKEKDQIIKAVEDTRGNIVPRMFINENLNGEEYYNQTYNNERIDTDNDRVY
jgi:hypothetical protein